MKRKAFSIVILIAAFAVIVLGSCVSSSSKDSVDWAGVYKSKVPLDNGSDLSVRLKLYTDQTFELRFECLDKSNETIDWTGWFMWDDTGNIIILDIIDAPVYYKVTKNMLIELNNKGKPVSKKQTDYYVLIKER